MEFGDRVKRQSRNALSRGRTKIATGGRRRWVRAVDGELVNLDGCDYVAVEKEHGETFAVIARMHGPAANWVLARYADRDDATRAQDWLANYLGARRVDIGARAEATDAADPAKD